MASFYSWMLPTKRRWRRIIAGYQDLQNDPGNWSSGKVGVGTLIGTNRSIAAPTLIDWRGQMVTKQEMMDLSITESMQIYRKKYWEPLLADDIQSQPIADLLADMKSSAGGNGVKEMQKALNSLGEKLSVDGSWGQMSLQALNRQINKVGEAKVYNLFRENMIAYYKRINSPFEKQLISSLEDDYPPMQERSWIEKNAFPIAVSGIAILILIYIYIKKNKVKNVKAK